MSKQVITGTIINMQSVVIGPVSRSVIILTLMKKARQHMEGRDEVYAAVFVEDSHPPHMVSEIACQMLCGGGSKVELTLNFDGEVPTGHKPCPTTMIPFTAINFIDDDD